MYSGDIVANETLMPLLRRPTGYEFVTYLIIRLDDAHAPGRESRGVEVGRVASGTIQCRDRGYPRARRQSWRVIEDNSKE